MATSTAAPPGARRREFAAAVPRTYAVPAWYWIAVVFAAIAVRLSIGPIVADDAFITFRYARELATSGAFEYNTGERVLGTTTPLFTLLMAGGLWVGWPAAWAAVLVSVTADAALIWLIAAWLVRAQLAHVAAIAAIMLAVWPLLVTYAIAGLETSLYTALVYGALTAGAARRPALAGVLAGLAVLCRPDAGIAAIVIAVSFAREPRQLAVFCGVAMVTVLPWVVFAYTYFGSVVPQSVVAKAALERGDFVGLHTFVGFFAGSVKYAFLSICAAAGSIVLWRTGGVLGRLLLVWAALYAAAFTVSNAFSDFPWYFVPLMPVYLAAVAACLTQLAWWWLSSVRAPGWARRPAAMAAILMVLLAAGVWHALRVERHLRSLASGREQLYAATAMRIAGESREGVVAATEVGTLGYYYPGPILDLIGLVSPQAVGRPPLEVLLEENAAWLVTYDTHFDRSVAASPEFTREYELVSRSPVSHERTLEVYRRRPR